VRHKDGDNYNCRAENLTYAPIAAAISKNSRKAGRYLTGKLNSQLAEDIRERSTRGEAVGQLAQEYGVSTSLISNIKHGKKWREQPASAEVPLEATLATILDVDDERRAGVAARLAPFFGQVDDVADVDSLLSNWPNDRYLVVCDEGAAIQKIQQAMRSTVDCRPHIVYAESPPLAAIVDAVSGGAADYLAWPCSQAYLGARVQAWPRRAAFSRRIHGTVSAALRKISSLSARERQVLRLVVLGRTSAEIGQQLAISGRTVEVHRNSVLRKLDVQSSTAAAKIAAEAGW
jgi:DNA-binding NarL/FixJ family response regulator